MGCKTNSDFQYLEQELKKSVNFSLPDQGETVIFLLSELDCEVCIESIFDWLSDIKQTKPSTTIKGLFYSPDNYAFSKKGYIDATNNK